jgi:hypothetical protein
MKNKLIILSISMLTLMSWGIKIENIISGNTKNGNTETTVNNYIQYTIIERRHYCDKSGIVYMKDSVLSFRVKLDNSAIYTTSNSSNQSDINKLFGFSDNNVDHHEYNARFR